MNKKNTLLLWTLLFGFLPNSIESNENNNSVYEPGIEDLNLPSGFKIEIFADGLNTPRQITETMDGHIIVGSKKGDKIIALIDSNEDGKFEEKYVLAEGLQNPTGVSFFNGDLYFAEIDTIWIIKNIDNWLGSDKKSKPTKSSILNGPILIPNDSNALST